MKVFVTGGSGFIGSYVVKALLSQGHDISVLVRSEASAAKLPTGVHAVKGSMEQLDLLAAEAGKADAVINLAFNHEVMQSGKYEEAIAQDLQAVTTILGALKSGQVYLGCGGTAAVGDTKGKVADETAPLPDSPASARAKAEVPVLQAAERGVRSAVIRLPPFVYDQEGAAFSKIITGLSQQLGFAPYKDTGDYHLAVVHVADVGQLYALALQHAKAGSVYNGNNGHVTGKQLAEAIATKLSIPAKSLTPEEMVSSLGPFLSLVAAMDCQVSNEKARTQLHWQPVHASQELLKAVSGS